MFTKLRQQIAQRRARRRAECNFVQTFDDKAKVESAVGQVDDYWRPRIDDVKAGPDNAAIPRVAGAGTIQGGWVTLHNGVRVSALGYHGAGILNMLLENGGVHEPQEERAFGEVLAWLPPQCTMIELGSYWGAYSLWLKRVRPEARCFLIEPNWCNLQCGRRNFEENGCTGKFFRAFVGAEELRGGWFGIPTITVDGFCRRNHIDRVHVLHADIQEAELPMLHGATRLLAERRADYIFISTHSNELHVQCADLLRQNGYLILASANLDESYSFDGILVARGPHVQGPDRLTIAHKPPPAAAPAG